MSREGLLRIGTTPTIGVFGHYGNQNLGDEAIIQAVIENCRARSPQARIVGFSVRPDDTAQRHGIESYPISRLPKPRDSAPSETQPGAATPKPPARKRRSLSLKLLQLPLRIMRAAAHAALEFAGEISFLSDARRRLKSIDALMIVGSNQFLDNYGGPWGFPYTLLKWSVLARVTSTPFAFVSVGAGPLDSKTSHRMVRWAVALSDYCSCRDDHSQALLQSIKVEPPPPVYPDLAFSIDTKHYALPTPARGQRAPGVIGINPMPVFDKRYWYVADDERYSAYVVKLADFSAALLNTGYTVRFWGTQPKDYNVIDDVLSRLTERHNLVPDPDTTVLRPTSVDDLLSAISGFDLAVATRFHGVVLPLALACPVIGIGYYVKSERVLAAMGQLEYSLDIETFDTERLMEKFNRLEARLPDEIRVIGARTQAARAALAAQYDTLLGARRGNTETELGQ